MYTHVQHILAHRCSTSCFSAHIHVPCIVPRSILGMVSFSLFLVIQSIFTTTGTEILLQNNIAKGGSSASTSWHVRSFLFLEYTSFSPHTPTKHSIHFSRYVPSPSSRKSGLYLYGVKGIGGGLSYSDLRIVRRRKIAVILR